MKIKKFKKNGFSILSVILVIVIVTVSIGAWAMSGENNVDKLRGNADIIASSVINDGAAFQLSYDRLIANGATPAAIVSMPNVKSTPSAPNLLDPDEGLEFKPVNKNMVRANADPLEGLWVYNPTGVALAGVGTAATDPVMLIVGLKDSVCRQINYNLYGSTTIPTFGSPALPNPAQRVAGATITNLKSTYTFSGGTARDWTKGCFATPTKPDWNFYFHILKVN